MLNISKGGRTMALRDKLRSRSEPFLQPGETIQEVFPAQAGNPWMVGLGGGLLMLLLGKPRDVVVTDRSVVVLRQSKLTATPKEILSRLPRDTRFGPVKGIWSKTELNGEMVWIHRRFHGDANRADAAVTSLSDPPAATTGDSTT
jgi:hypothetical protein